MKARSEGEKRKGKKIGKKWKRKGTRTQQTKIFFVEQEKTKRKNSKRRSGKK